MSGCSGITDSSEHIGNGICDLHLTSSFLSLCLPAGLTDTRNLALVGKFPEAQTADAVFPDIGIGPTAKFAAMIRSCAELAGFCCFNFNDVFAISLSSRLLAERHAQQT
jgi:hypothetical protein